MEMKKLLELAGVDAHVKAEEKVFKEVCASLDKLAAFCDKQDEPTYNAMKKQADALCAKLHAHLERYKK